MANERQPKLHRLGTGVGQINYKRRLAYDYLKVSGQLIALFDYRCLSNHDTFLISFAGGPSKRCRLE
jgi:hypothetical protein